MTPLRFVISTQKAFCHLLNNFPQYIQSNLAFHELINVAIYLHPQHYPPHHRHRYHHYQPGWPRQELDQAVQDSLQVKPKPEKPNYYQIRCNLDMAIQ